MTQVRNLAWRAAGLAEAHSLLPNQKNAVFTAEMEFKILFMDDWIVAVEKPSGILVHRTGISEDRIFVLQELRNQLGRHVYPVHRLDRGTSGVLLFALDSVTAAKLQAALDAPTTEKTYFTIVRGWLPDEGSIDTPLEKDGTGELQDALTQYKTLAHLSLDMPVDRYPSARYTLAAVRLHTGRMHQIRRHFAHLRHPVLCDRKRGDRHHNHAWENQLGIRKIMLFAWRLALIHPITQEALSLEAKPEEHFLQACKILRLNLEEYLNFRWI